MGIDGCRAGWVIASAEGSLDSFGFSLVPSLDAVFEWTDRNGAIVAIDVPIGLSEDGSRDCDLAARAFLKGHRKSSVFPAPCRATLVAGTYREACELNAHAGGKKVTKELYNILPKIREVDLLMSPARQARIRESHPEVIFATLAGEDAPPLPPKRQSDGSQRRVEILRWSLPQVSLASLYQERLRITSGRPSEGIDVIIGRWEALASKPGANMLALNGPPPGLQPRVPAPAFQGRAGDPFATEDLAPSQPRLSGSSLALDDLIDALACLVAAHRLSAGVARVFPEGEARLLDARGLRMEIVA
ncbi:MAG: DUF429 domain-containing protein [Chloroflexota bacterium]